MSDIFATLIAHGHGDPSKLTRRQIHLYYAAAKRREHRARAERIEDMNMAMRGGSKSVQEFVDRMRNPDDASSR